MASAYEFLKYKQPVDVVFKIDVNEWNGEKNLQLRVIDCLPSEEINYKSID